VGRPRLLVVVAHPDDESFGCGGVIASAARSGAAVTVCCATRGEAGEVAEGSGVGAGELPQVREAELREAAAVLGATDVVLLDFGDSGMAGDAPPHTLVGAPLDAVVAAVTRVLDDVVPDVVVTMDETGGDGHRDHVRIAAATTEAVRRRPGPHLYQWCLSRGLLQRWVEQVRAALPDSEHLDVDPSTMGRPDGDITTLLDVADLEDVRWAAIRAHRSQHSPYEVMPPDLQAAFLRTDRLVRVVPPWDGGPTETALRWPASSGRS
jgi:LmbE family N-acetylglucosaminyl deacetylase